MTVISSARQGGDGLSSRPATEVAVTAVTDVIDAFPDPFVVLAVERDCAGRVVDFVVSSVNSAASSFLDRPPRELLGASVRTLIPSYGRDGHVSLLEAVLESGEPLTIDDYPVRSDTEPLTLNRLDLRIVRWRDGLVLTWRDVTRRFEVADGLRRSEERLRLAMDRTPIGLAVLDLDGSILEANAELCRLLERDHVWLSSRRIEDVLAPGEFAQFRRMCQSLVGGRSHSEEVEQRFVTGAGEPLTLFHTVALVRDSDGRPVSYVAQFARLGKAPLAEAAVPQNTPADLRTTVLVVSHLMGPLPALAFTTLLRARADLAVLPAAGRAELVERLVHDAPDVVVLMVAPGQSGSHELNELLELIDRVTPDCGVVVVSPNNQRLIQRELSERGGSAAFVSVASVRDDEALARTVQSVADGMSLDGAHGTTDFAELTEREFEVLQLMAEGLDNGAIAEALFVTVKSVESHVSAIFRKLGLNDSIGTSKRLKAVLEYLSAQ